MLEITGGKKERLVREWINAAYTGRVPNQKVLDLYTEFKATSPDAADVSYGLFNGVLKKLVPSEEAEPDQPVRDSVVEPEILRVDAMQFPNFERFRAHKKIDDLFSDHEPGGGIYGGTVNIVIGESGVGKSTVMLDLLASIAQHQPEAKVLYISSEMTRNDIGFYYRKTPAIGAVPTLLLMDYVKSGQLSQVLAKAFNGGHDIILLDSYQDVIVKLKEVHGWKSTKAEAWLTGAMIDAAENKGCSVLAIQHMTKGGQYVGSTYLKHATTAMLEIRFDLSGSRYIEFSKNRRGGSGVGNRLYYSLDDTGSVVYDEARYTETQQMKQIETRETIRQQDLTRQFEEMFLRRPAEEEAPEPEPVEAAKIVE